MTGARTFGSPGRLLMLVPHEPDLDPRIAWVTALCAQIGRTDVLGTTWSTEKVSRKYDGVTYLERVNILEHASPLARAVGRASARCFGTGPVTRLLARDWRPPRAAGVRGVCARLDHSVGSVLRFFAAWGSYAVFISALHRRARAVSIPPRVVICHDLFALIPGVLLKRRYGCRLIYDSHEFWPEADLLAPRWQVVLLTRFERLLARQADVVVTVSPPLARHLARLHGLRRVLSAPNAERYQPEIAPSCVRPPARPVCFLLQGQVVPGRGIERFLKAWNDLDDDRAILYIRSPQNPYLTRLLDESQRALQRGRIVCLAPVREPELITAASFADVGVIPYLGPNLNHVYACPNKLSQFMHAGLAILTNRLEFVTEVVERYRCGVAYDADDGEGLARAVNRLVGDLDELGAMKRRAWEAFRSEFNWDVQSRDYQHIIRELYGAGTET